MVWMLTVEDGPLGLRQIGMISWCWVLLTCKANTRLLNRNGTGLSRWNLVCQTLPRTLHLKKQQAQGKILTDPDELELVKPKDKGRKKVGGGEQEQGDDKGAEHEEHGGGHTGVHGFPTYEQPGSSAPENQALERNITTEKRALDSDVAGAPTSTNKRAKTTNLEPDNIIILDDDSDSDTEELEIVETQMGNRSVSVTILDN